VEKDVTPCFKLKDFHETAKMEDCDEVREDAICVHSGENVEQGISKW
jgi:hypothetical protein